MAMVVPIAIGAGMAGAGIAGAVGSGALGKVGGVQQPYVDADGYTYGGDPRYYEEFRKRLEQQEKGALKRDAYQADFSQADADYANAGLARAQQQQLVDQYGAVVAGTAGPSLAEQQMRAGQTQAAAQAMQMAASTRGGTAAQLAAQRSAQQQATMGQAQVARDAAMLRAKEVQEARAAQAGLLSTMRQGDYAGRAGGQQQAMGQAGLEAQQRALNDQRAMGLLGAEHNATMGKLQGSMGYQQASQQASEWAQSQNSQIDQQNKQRSAQFWGSLLGAGGALMGKGAMGGG
jgi:hypothetical protein